MNRDTYSRACEIFLELSEAPDGDARARAACGGDAQLLKQVLELLEGDARGDLELVDREGPRRLADDEDRSDVGKETIALEHGTIVGDYRLIECIGEGGMGQVWKAEQTNLGGRHVAVKFVRPDRISTHQLELFAREARAGGRLQHPGIVAVFNSGNSGGLHWIAMEYVEGGRTLKDLINELAELGEVAARHDREVARLVAEIAEALQTAHEAGVIHRDIKPHNVLLTPEGNPKVMDFGIARIVDETGISNTGEVAGTYFYMSPEQVAPEARGTDQRADVFGLGVVLYELLALRRPFQGDTPHHVVRQILTEDPPDPRALRSRIPADLAVITGKAMEKDPDRRYTSMKELAADLRRHLANEAILARPPTRWYRARKWVRRNPTKSVAGTVALLSAAIIAALLFQNLRRELLLARQSADLGRLLDLQEDEDLIAAADSWWPVRPEWIDEYETWIASATDLVALLHVRDDGTGAGWLAELEQLRARSIPWAEHSEEERQAARRSHPRYDELVGLERELEALRRANEVRMGRVAMAEVELEITADDPAATLIGRARAMTGPGRRLQGREAQALASTRRALELVEDDAAYATTMEAHAWAAFRNGLDEEALEAGGEVLAIRDALGDEQRARAAARFVEQLESAIASAASELSTAEARLALLEAEIGARQEWRFAAQSDRLWHDQLVSLIAELRALEDPEVGLLGTDSISPIHGWSIPKRLALATHLREAFGEDGEYARRWANVLPAIHAEHPGIELEALTGLVPIGRDPHSGLFEFWHVMSGEEPSRSEDGVLGMTVESGLVLVLMPGGTFSMGAQPGHPDRANHDPRAEPPESPVHRVTLSPFFISKHEMTQAQWERITGENPSYCKLESWNSNWSLNGLDIEDPRRHPVEQVSWQQCEATLARMDLVLPTEAQWEFAARGGSSQPRWPGVEARGLEGAENIADERFGLFNAQRAAGCEAWNDGYGVHAPVGSFRANPYGLFDVLGNVLEWCRDEYDADAYALSEAFDPLARPQGKPQRVNRGGSWNVSSNRARVSRRGHDSISRVDSTLGIRPARSLAP